MGTHVRWPMRATITKIIAGGPGRQRRPAKAVPSNMVHLSTWSSDWSHRVTEVTTQ
jgi:hypothetical protein